ncbi:MAG TPA: HAD family hydrolase [Alphaproteobacteria bacterium]|jgi:phosphoglycolate phosphatase
MSWQLSPPRAILFDWDNTLVDTWGTIQAALNAALTAMGFPAWTMDECRMRVRASLRDTFPRMFGERWPEARDIFYSTYRASHLETLRALPEAERVTRRLACQGLYLGVVSNKTGPLLRAEAAKLGWERNFGRLVGAGDAKVDKPAPDPIYLATQELGISDYKTVWYVGDAAIDVECARHAGCIAILVGPAAGEEDRIKQLNPEAQLDRLADVLDLVRQSGLTI